MKIRPFRFVLAAMAVVVMGACSGSESADETEQVAASTASSEVVTETTEQRAPDADDGIETTDVEAPTPETSAPPTTEPPAPPEPIFGTWDEPIDIEAADGEFEGRPVLSWSPVEGADHYGVYVYASDGQIYWAWRGRETSTTLGGDIGDAEGPIAAEGMTWAVIAWDADLLPVTASLVEPLPA